MWPCVSFFWYDTNSFHCFDGFFFFEKSVSYQKNNNATFFWYDYDSGLKEPFCSVPNLSSWSQYWRQEHVSPGPKYFFSCYFFLEKGPFLTTETIFILNTVSRDAAHITMALWVDQVTTNKLWSPLRCVRQPICSLQCWYKRKWYAHVHVLYFVYKSSKILESQYSTEAIQLCGWILYEGTSSTFWTIYQCWITITNPKIHLEVFLLTASPVYILNRLISVVGQQHKNRFKSAKITMTHIKLKQFLGGGGDRGGSHLAPFLPVRAMITSLMIFFLRVSKSRGIKQGI